jgi:protein-S-isoprenylcysteine O-methyltransferase Ste14
MEKQRRPMVLAASIGAAVGAIAAALGTRRGLRSRHAFLSQSGWFSLDPAVWDRWPIFAACAALWVAFGLYWEIAAKDAAKAKSSESRSSRGVHVVLVNIAQILVLFPIVGLGRFLPGSRLTMIAGLLVQFAGTALAVWARIHLGRNWSGAIAIKEEHQLIQSGPYRRLRHPIYTGLLAMYIGAAIVTGEWLAVIGVAIVVVAYWRKIRLEEAAVGMAFGPAYEAYRRETWALIPGVY